MPISVTMPRLGESVTEGTVTRWLKNAGDHVEADEPLLEVATDKVDTEVPSPVTGTLLSIKVYEDETVEIGVELAVIDESDNASSGEAAEPQLQPAKPQPGQPAHTATPEPQLTHASQRAAQQPGTAGQAPPPNPQPRPSAKDVSSPSAASEPIQSAVPDNARRPSTNQGEAGGTHLTALVRKLAGEHGVDLPSIRGTGLNGRIRKSDVLAAAGSDRQAAAKTAVTPVALGMTARTRGATSQAPSEQRGRVEPMSHTRQALAARLVQSLQTSAQLTTVVEVDVTKIARLVETAEARGSAKVGLLPFFALAATEALEALPVFNSSIDVVDQTITYHDAVHLGVVVDAEQGPLVPVIRNAGDLNLGGLARTIADLTERAKASKVSSDELGGETFTITNTDSDGSLFDTPIVNQPQVAMLSIGAVGKRPVVVADNDLRDAIAIRSMMYLALSYDHRIIDGADTARFLSRIKIRLEAGQFEQSFSRQ